ncbi:MAG: hypothetical protein IMZ49_00390, partial [Actinobacteria bacterium]|nr:hypothetical protein [Actinomycetota bacterium]
MPLIVDAMPEQMALAQTPGAFGARAVKILRNIGETGKADILEKMQTTVAETVRAKAKAIIEPYVMYLLGGKLIEEGVEGTKAYLGETPAESVAAVFTNPQLLAERVGGMIPYTVGTVALAIATEGTAAPFILTYLIEGEAAAQAAADRGASPAEQSDIGQIVGFINGAVEMWQVSKILEFVGGKAATKAFAGNASKAAVAKVAASSAAKSAWSKGVSVGVETVKLAVTEGGQETLQQATTETATCGITNEPLDPGFWERLILAGGLGAVASVITGGLFAGGQKALGIKAKTETAAPEAAAAPPVSAEAPVGAETPPAAAVAPAQPEDAKARKDAPLVELMAAEDALEMAFAAVRAAKPADLSAAKKSMVAAAVTWEAALARYTTWRDADVALAPAQPETVPEVGDETGVDRGMVVLPRGEPAAAERVVPAPEPGRDLMPAEPAAVEPSRWERGEESLAEKFSSGLYAGSVLEGGEVDPRADKGAWRSMGPKELQSILAGKMSGGAANAGKKGHYYSWFPSYSAAIKGKKGKPKFLVEFAGQASEDETTVTPVGRADISGVWVSEGGEWRKITPQALETEYGFSAPALARQEPTAAPAAATGFLSILTTEEQDEAERLKREIAHDMRSPQAVG